MGPTLKFRSFLIVFLILGFWISTSNAQNDLLDGFQHPPASAKARTWWHWINGNVSKEGITADLEAMKQVGIQEAQIFNVDQGYPDGEATFLSPKWLDLFTFAVAEAERLGLEIGFHNGAGWSSSGGPWITPENGMQTIVYTEIQISKAKKGTIHQKLQQPATKLNYYKDIAVIAFPTPQHIQRIDGLDIKSLSNDGFKTHLYPDDKEINRLAIVNKSKVIDLSDKMHADGTLKWDMPPGNWTIIRFGHTANGTENRPSGLGGKGLEVNKMSRTALDVYWEGGIKPILDKVGPLVGSSLTNCLIDSYEVGCNNWTPGLFEEFESRRNYDLKAYLPTLAGYYVESGEISERFLWDFRKTIGDLIAENYYGYFRDLCHKNGMKFSVEPYGGPFEALKVGSYGDISMSEFWLGRNEYSESSKLAASVSHLKGNAITGAESFTSLGGWTTHPATMKSAGDFIWSEGVNRFIFHTYVHQPWNISPGVTFHMYGVEMSRLNTWWKQSTAYMSYIARSQFLLQQGQSFADVLVFTGESSPNDAIYRSDIKALGYDYDQIGSDELIQLTVKNGTIYTRSGLSYRMLILPDTKWATPALLEKIKELVTAGAVVTGTKPTKSPSLQGYPASDNLVVQLANDIWDRETVHASSFSVLSDDLQLVPDFNGGATGADLHFIHRKVGDNHIYFIANPKNEYRIETCRFRIEDLQPTLWNAEKGTVEDIAVWRNAADNTIEIPLSFEGNGSFFIVFTPKKTTQSGHITHAQTTMHSAEQKPLLDLQVLSADYGTFLPDRIADVTEILTKQITADSITILANNSLTTTDPAPGSVKTLYIAYTLSGITQQLQLIENEKRTIKFNKNQFKLLKAFYGKLPNEMDILGNYDAINVKSKINNLISSGTLTFKVTDSLFAISPVKGTVKKDLRLTYATEGKIQTVDIQHGGLVRLAQNTAGPKLVHKDGISTWITPRGGKLTYTTHAGIVKHVEVKDVPQPIELNGPWSVSFPATIGATGINTTFDQLQSWHLSSNENIRYFSGTAVYKKQFDLTAKLLKPNYTIELDLGSVHVIAEVIVNGENLGIIWNPPFRLELGKALRTGKNDLEIRITNLWPNRLIGDAQIPDDVLWGDYLPKEWPTWLADNGASRTSKRKTFTTWRHWGAKSGLQTSGLLGPVLLRIYRHEKLSL